MSMPTTSRRSSWPRWGAGVRRSGKASTPSHLRHVLRRVYAAAWSPHVSKDELDDLSILDAWLRRHRGEFVEVAVSLEQPEAAAPALRAALAPAVTA